MVKLSPQARLVYLGKRGGGLNLYTDTVLQLESAKIPTLNFVSSHLQECDDVVPSPSKTWSLYSPKKFTEMFNINAIYKSLIGLRFFFKTNNSFITVFIMPSPFDFLYLLISRFGGGASWVCIHDYTPHLGEFWPRKRSIHFRIKVAHELIAFSKPIGDHLRNYTKKPVYLVNLPNTIPNIGNVDSDVSSTLKLIDESAKSTVLLIGRNPDYKNSQAMIVLARHFKHVNFLVAGENINSFPPLPNLFIIDKWLSNAEFDTILEFAPIVIFPYLEASQSGTIPLAIQKRKIVIASNQPGLIYQLDGYAQKIIYNTPECSDEFEAINKALKIIQTHVRSEFSEAIREENGLSNLIEHQIREALS